MAVLISLVYDNEMFVSFIMILLWSIENFLN